MRAINVSGVVADTNPLAALVDVADASIARIIASKQSVHDLTLDLMSDEQAATRNPNAFASLYGAMMGIVPAFAALGDASRDLTARIDGALSFIWAYASDAYDYACEVLGDDAERLQPMQYANLIAGFYGSLIVQIREEMLGSGRVLQ